ncbi:MAG TPA: hypothetical protein VK436_07530 [Methanocella sp.]|nr:hypothetical protein [Methanocella sp.]
MMSDKTSVDLGKFRDRIVRDSIKEFRTASYFQGKGRQTEQIVQAVSEGLIDLLEEGPSRDPYTVKLFVEWLYNLIRKEGKKVDTTVDFLDRFENLAARHLDKVEGADVDVFFEMCREFVQDKHAQLMR